jgi:hypothetical protein
MSLTTNYNIGRNDLQAVLLEGSTRGLILDGYQVEMVRVTKLTGDASGNVTLDEVKRPHRVLAVPLTDSAGTAITTEPTAVDVAFVHVDNVTITISSLGNWTSAMLLVTGRSFKYA